MVCTKKCSLMLSLFLVKLPHAIIESLPFVLYEIKIFLWEYIPLHILLLDSFYSKSALNFGVDLNTFRSMFLLKASHSTHTRKIPILRILNS